MPSALPSASAEDVGEPEEEVVVALGSNLGDRMGNLRAAVRALGEILEVEAVSSILESPPQGFPEGEESPDFLNAVLRGRTAQEPEALLDACHGIEASAGRPRARPLTSRTLDLDIIFHGDRVRAGPGLVLPHPRWKERGFVLRPLLEIAPEWVDPETGSSVEEICRERSYLLAEGRVVAPGDVLRP